MTPKKVENIVRVELGSILFKHELQRDNFYFFQDDEYANQINFYTKKVGGEIYLLTSNMFSLRDIENKWINYQPELGLQTNLFNQSFHQSYNVLDKETFPTLTNLGLMVHYNESEDWVKEIVRKIVLDYFLPFSEKLKDIQYCNQLINKDIEITEEVTKISPIDGLPFRKIFIAEEAGNPNIHVIKEAMRKYVNERFKVGMEKGYDKLCKIKPVFEKLFGT